MRRRLRSALMHLPGGAGYRLARALGVQAIPSVPSVERNEPASRNGSGSAPLEVAMEQEGRRKRLRVRASGDIWSEEFRQELAEDRRFEASLVWRELAILLFVAAVLVARTLGS
jgi:hypothetical protein